MRPGDVIPRGRSFEESRRMFALGGDDLAGTVLGCGDGPAGFNARRLDYSGMREIGPGAGAAKVGEGPRDL